MNYFEAQNKGTTPASVYPEAANRSVPISSWRREVRSDYRVTRQSFISSVKVSEY
jgi:hypothetical protein